MVCGRGSPSKISKITMEDVFYKELKRVEGADHGLHLLAIGFSSEIYSADLKHMESNASLLIPGWLNVEALEGDVSDSSMTSFPNGKLIKLQGMFIGGDGRVTAASDIRVGIIAMPNDDGQHAVAAMLLFVHNEAWRRQWRLYRTVSNAAFVSHLLLAWLPQVQVFQLGTKMAAIPNFSGEASADLSVWMTSREKPASPSSDVFFCTKHEFIVPLFYEPADGATITLDLYSGSVSPTGDRQIRVPAGGILTGTPGSGKFHSLLRHMSSQGKPKTRRTGAASAAATYHAPLRSPATLIVVPVAAAQWRLRQIHEVFPAPKHTVLEIMTHAHFDQATWADVLTADIVVIADSVLQSKSYTKHASTFLGNVYSNPETAAAHMADMRCTIFSKATTTSRRKRVRLEGALAMSPEAELFFSQVVTPKGGAVTKFLHGIQGMVASVSYQLAKAPAGWDTCFRRPVFQAIYFARVILADIQSYSNVQLDAALGLAASIKWATDSCTTSSWMERASRWDVILERSLRQKFDQNFGAKFGLLRGMMSALQTRKVQYTTAVDTIQRTLLDNLNAEPPGKVITQDDLVRPLHRNICLVSPEELVVEILLERERALLQTCFGRCRVIITTENIVVDHDDGGTSPSSSNSSDSSASSSESSDDSSYSGGEEEDDDDDDEDDTAVVDVEEGEEKEDEAALHNNLVMDLRNYLMEFGIGQADTPPAPAPSAAVTPTPNHAAQQTGLARRLEVALATEIGKEPCKICTVDVCNGFLSCGHAFCYKCIREWVDGHNTMCPFCMREFVKEPPFYVPTVYRSYPLPAHCAAEDAHAWAAEVCKPNLSSVAFWCLAAMLAAERAGKPLVFLVDSDVDMKNVAGMLSKWKDTRGTWPCTAYTGACVTRQRLENKFKAGSVHLILCAADVLAGCRLEGVSQVLSLCESITEEVANALALRLGAIHIRSCVYSDGEPILV
jgi:hypothetical protein